MPVAVEPVPRTTRIVTLASRPDGRPTPANFGVDERPVGEPGPGQVLVRNVYMSVDPAMRGRMEPTEKHYTTNFSVGGPLDGSAIGRVIASRADGFAAGDFVRHRLGWRDYALVDGAAATVVDATLAPLPNWLGVLGQPGFTAYAGLRRAGDIQPGDVVFVSAAAGAVGSTAGQLARLLGASRVIGSAGGAERPASWSTSWALTRGSTTGRACPTAWRRPRRTASTCTSTTWAGIIWSPRCTRCGCTAGSRCAG